MDPLTLVELRVPEKFRLHFTSLDVLYFVTRCFEIQKYTWCTGPVHGLPSNISQIASKDRTTNVKSRIPPVFSEFEARIR